MFFLTKELYFPPVEQANSSGMLAIGGDLSVDRLILAYQSGIFPWYSDNEPIIWWAPPKRMVIFPKEYKVPKTMRNIINQSKFEITLNKCFSDVVNFCKDIERVGQAGTWINNDIVDAYTKLHRLGIAKSVEVWYKKQLIGGLYGVDLGNGIFCGESMFSKVSNASKIAFIWLVKYLKKYDYLLLDCQVYNDHLALLGAHEISREEYMEILEKSFKKEK